MPPSDTARRLFTGIAPNYDRPAEVLSLFQYTRWHRFLLSKLRLSGEARVLDMATGTGAVALKLARGPTGRVVGADVTRPMLMQAKARAEREGLSHRLELAECTAEAIPFVDDAFDAVIFTYLLRYVSDVPSTLRELARVLKPGGAMVSLDFAVPGPVIYPLWRLYTSVVLPLAGAVLSSSWMKVGSFLDGSIRGFYRQWPEQRLADLWRECGFPGVTRRHLSLGGALVMWGIKAE
jgi:demethylmenaquinone methyltransferase/2-methoxy-6-polyprenyl-1,4-benzoquinol methylase